MQKKQLKFKWQCEKCKMSLTQNQKCFACGNTDNFIISKIKKIEKKSFGGITIKINV